MYENERFRTVPSSLGQLGNADWWLQPAIGSRKEPGLREREQFGDRAFQDCADTNDIQNGDIAFTTLDLPHVTSIDLGCMCQRFLGQAKFFSERSDRLSQGNQIARFIRRARDPLHARMVAVACNYDHGIYDPKLWILRT